MTMMNSNDLKTLPVSKVAELLCIHRVKAYKLIRDGVIPSIKFGKSIRIRETTLLEWMENAENLSHLN